MALRLTRKRITFDCLACDASVVVLAVTNSDAGCPEFLQPAPGSWVATVAEAEGPVLVAVCSKKCRDVIVRAAEAENRNREKWIEVSADTEVADVGPAGPDRPLH